MGRENVTKSITALNKIMALLVQYCDFLSINKINFGPQ